MPRCRRSSWPWVDKPPCWDTFLKRVLRHGVMFRAENRTLLPRVSFLAEPNPPLEIALRLLRYVDPVELVAGYACGEGSGRSTYGCAKATGCSMMTLASQATMAS